MVYSGSWERGDQVFTIVHPVHALFLTPSIDPLEGEPVYSPPELRHPAHVSADSEVVVVSLDFGQ